MSLQYVNFEEVLAAVSAKAMVVRINSRDVRPGDIFVALPPTVQGGAQSGAQGGEQYFADALAAGATLVVCEERHAALAGQIKDSQAGQGAFAICVVPSSRAALGELALAMYGPKYAYPSLVGISGTNGKTTSAYMLESLFRSLGYKTGVLGTIAYRWPGFSQDAPLTTPGCLQLHELMSAMGVAEVEMAFMEVSSHALEQERIAGLDFRATLLTNITQDHLDYHHNMENYYQAKARLFRSPDLGGVPAAGGAPKLRVVNADDPYGSRLLQELVGEGKTENPPFAFSLKGVKTPGAFTLACRVASLSINGLQLELFFEGLKWKLSSPLVGMFNVYNLIGVQALALGLGVVPEDLAQLEHFHGVPGRLERVANKAGLNVFVDYAHTPDALINVQATLRDCGFKRLVTVFGCGGDRDRTKRPLMGEAVCRYSDVAVLTSDNPRHEDPEKIMEDVMPGLKNCREVYSIASRKEAIIKGLQLVGPEDVLLIAGKGHESYQQIGAEKFPFSDQAVVMEVLACV